MPQTLDNSVEPTTTYRRDFKSPTQYPPKPKSTYGTLLREGILPIVIDSAKGLKCTRFLSDNDVQLAAFATYLGVNVFPNKPFTSKEQRMVGSAGFNLGLSVQHGGFLGKKRCLVKKHQEFKQSEFKKSEVQTLLKTEIDYASLWKGKGIIHKTDTLRLDRQNETKTHQNLQIQVNKTRGKNESTTVATVLLNRNLENLSGKNLQMHQAHVLRKTKQAFFLSTQTGSVYEVTLGEIPTTPLTRQKKRKAPQSKDPNKEEKILSI